MDYRCSRCNRNPCCCSINYPCKQHQDKNALQQAQELVCKAQKILICATSKIPGAGAPRGLGLSLGPNNADMDDAELQNVVCSLHSALQQMTCNNCNQLKSMSPYPAAETGCALQELERLLESATDHLTSAGAIGRFDSKGEDSGTGCCGNRLSMDNALSYGSSNNSASCPLAARKPVRRRKCRRDGCPYRGNSRTWFKNSNFTGSKCCPKPQWYGPYEENIENTPQSIPYGSHCPNSNRMDSSVQNQQLMCSQDVQVSWPVPVQESLQNPNVCINPSPVPVNVRNSIGTCRAWGNNMPCNYEANSQWPDLNGPIQDFPPPQMMAQGASPWGMSDEGRMWESNQYNDPRVLMQDVSPMVPVDPGETYPEFCSFPQVEFPQSPFPTAAMCFQDNECQVVFPPYVQPYSPPCPPRRVAFECCTQTQPYSQGSTQTQPPGCTKGVLVTLSLAQPKCCPAPLNPQGYQSASTQADSDIVNNWINRMIDCLENFMTTEVVLL